MDWLTKASIQRRQNWSKCLIKMQHITVTAVIHILGNHENEEEYNEWDTTTTVLDIHTETFADTLVDMPTDIHHIQLIDIHIVIIQLRCHFLSIFLVKSKFQDCKCCWWIFLRVFKSNKNFNLKSLTEILFFNSVSNWKSSCCSLPA